MSFIQSGGYYPIFRVLPDCIEYLKKASSVLKDTWASSKYLTELLEMPEIFLRSLFCCLALSPKQSEQECADNCRNKPRNTDVGKRQFLQQRSQASE